MYPTRIVIRPCLARASIWALEVTAWLILSATVPGNPRDNVRAHTGDADIVFPDLSGCRERAYGSNKSGRFGGADLEISESALKRKPSLSSERRSVTCTAELIPAVIVSCAVRRVGGVECIRWPRLKRFPHSAHSCLGTPSLISPFLKRAVFPCGQRCKAARVLFASSLSANATFDFSACSRLVRAESGVPDFSCAIAR